MNRAVFKTIHVDVLDDEPQPHERGEIAADGHLTAPVAAMALVVEDALAGQFAPQEGTQGRTAGEGAAPTAAKGQSKTPAELSLAGGSNVYNLAEREGFEPSKAFTLPLFESGQFNHSCISPVVLF